MLFNLDGGPSTTCYLQDRFVMVQNLPMFLLYVAFISPFYMLNQEASNFHVLEPTSL